MIERLLGLPLPGALRPDPGTARDWLRHELARRPYQRSLVERVGDWFDDLLGRLREATTSSGGLGLVLAVVVLVVLAAGLALLLSRLRGNAPARGHEATVFADTRESGGAHRRRAAEALQAQRWDEAVVEAVRALASELFERGLLPQDLDVTVHEVTERGSVLFPDHADRLRAAGRAFEDTRYGERPATRDQAEAAVALDHELLGLAPHRGPAREPVSAVPR